MAENRREFSRVSLRLRAEFGLSDRTVRGEAEELSMAGVFLVVDASAKLETEGQLTLFFGDEPTTLELFARAKVVRCTDRGLGLRFQEVGLETYHHLRSLVLNNADDYEAAREEIDAHQGLKRRDPG